ncbi:hypothetical protein [Prolixibacter sp. SD074]|uniref:MutS-related protein n=1 Tax=Prolixibacter sp. SD074 TaxID=2652391 RepID=UPI001271DD1B|nr:hypothetical protein [Prolixibacter sp. SD074]GET29913.1 hypothetical protein SD074_21150 [Prolixibacter sp. SD074]
MNALEYYKKKEHELVLLEGKLQKKRKILVVNRVISFFCSFIILGLFYWVGESILLLLPIGLMVFFYFVRKDYLLGINLENVQAAIRAVNNEIASLESQKYSGFNGECFKSNSHPYTSDLHVFGENSLFHFLNRTFTLRGQRKLAKWLSSAASDTEIVDRQNAVRELASLPDFLLNILALSELNKEYQVTESLEILETCSSSVILRKLKYVRFLSFFLSSINVGVFVLWIIGYASFIFPLIIIPVTYFLIHVIADRYLNSELNETAKLSNQLLFFEQFILVFEKREFHSKLLTGLSSQFSLGGTGGAAVIKMIRKALERNDIRLNLVIQLMVNSWLHTDIWFFYSFYAAREKYNKRFSLWFSAIAKLEALISLGVLQFNNNWCFPIVDENKLQLDAENFGHPLISPNQRVLNSVSMDAEGRLIVITGSNMSGKSTLLRSIGINMVLALAGAPACAQKFSIGNFVLMTYMVISDSLDDNISTFQAELIKIRHVLEAIKEKENVFVLLDELLRGTNTKDRELGSKAIVSKLIQDKVFSIVSTHDLNLATIELQYPKKVKNMHFDIKIEDNSMFFDYKLKDGICNNFNASLLLKEIGLDLNDINGDM